MNTRQRLGVAGTVVLASAVVGVATAPALPPELTTRWNADGEPGDTLPKAVGIGLLPGLWAVLLGQLPPIGPLGANVAAFRAPYDRFAVVPVWPLAVTTVVPTHSEPPSAVDERQRPPALSTG